MSLVSRRRRRKAVFPVACPATIRVYPLKGPSGRAAMEQFREARRGCAGCAGYGESWWSWEGSLSRRSSWSRRASWSILSMAGGRKGANELNGERLAGRGLPWLAEATLCGALNSPAGLTFLSLRGAAPASYPEHSTKSDPIIIHSARLAVLRLHPLPFFSIERGEITIWPRPSVRLHPHGRPSRAPHKPHLLTRGHPKELCPVAADQKHLRLPLMV
jgi:hypothetical protein